MVSEVWQKVISPDSVYIIAEAGVNHNGELSQAKELVDAAVSAGADAVKFQTFKADKLVSTCAPKAAYQVESTSNTESQYEMLKKLELGESEFFEIKEYCGEQGIQFVSTPFDVESADVLIKMGVPFLKIGSGELTDLSFLSLLAKKGLPLILSTGMASLSEVKLAVEEIKKTENKCFALLHCVSNYPANPEEANLRAMQVLSQAFHVPVGFSDHTLGIEVSLAAVALGAQVIEKHFTLDKNLEGPDHKFSLSPEELNRLVEGSRKIEKALGHGNKEPVESEKKIARVARKSLVAACDISKGSILTEDKILVKRPGTGVSPYLKDQFIGREVKSSISKDDFILFEHIV